MKIIVHEIQNTLKLLVLDNCNFLSSGQFVMYCLVSLLHVFFFSSFFLSFLFFLVLFVSVHKISILSIFLWLLFHLSDLYIITTIFFNSVNPSFTYYGFSIPFSSYFVINNSMPFDFVLNFKTRTMSQNLEPIVFTSVLI